MPLAWQDVFASNKKELLHTIQHSIQLASQGTISSPSRVQHASRHRGDHRRHQAADQFRQLLRYACLCLFRSSWTSTRHMEGISSFKLDKKPECTCLTGQRPDRMGLLNSIENDQTIDRGGRTQQPHKSRTYVILRMATSGLLWASY